LKCLLTNKGFTLIEVILIIVIVGILGSIALKTMGTLVEKSRETATLEEMENIVEAIVGDNGLVEGGIRSNYGYIGDIGSIPPNLDALVSNPGGYSTWSGPYFQNSFQENPNDYMQDAWGAAYTFAGGVSITSTGSGTNLTNTFAQNTTDLTTTTVSGIIVDKSNNAPQGSAPLIQITIFYPDGSGNSTSSAINPDTSGNFTFASMIPIGNHKVSGVYSATSDTALAIVSVTPVTGGFCELRFAGDFSGGVPPSGSVVYEDSSDANASSNTRSLTITTPGLPGSIDGHLLIAAVAVDGNVSGSLAPPGGEGWNEIDIDDRSNQVTLGVWWKVAGAAESASHRFTWSSNQEAYGFIMRFSGQHVLSPINDYSTYGRNSSSPRSPAVTTTVANAMIVRIGGFDDDDINVGNPGLAGHTAITMDESGSGSGTCSAGAGYTEQSAAGNSGTSNFSLNGNEQSRMVTIAIAPAS